MTFQKTNVNELDLDAARVERQVTNGILLSLHLHIHSLSPLPHVHAGLSLVHRLTEFCSHIACLDAWGRL